MTARAEDHYLEALLLERYCSDTASSAEAARIEAWFRVHPDQRAWYEQFKTEIRKQKYSGMSAENRLATIEEIIRAALQQRPAYDGKHGSVAPLSLDATSLAYQTSPEHSGQRLGTGPQTFRTARQKEGVFSGGTLLFGVVPRPRSHMIWSAAAVLALIATVTVLGWRAGASHIRERVAQSTLTYTTGNGQRANITLPDGSTASLNVASRLEVPTDYVTGNRTVRLTGEALFSVAHHAGMPFTVIAGGATAQVLGTSFLVRHYTSDTTTTVAVRTGKVAVRAVVLTAARQVVIGLTGAMREQLADAAQFSFTTGVLTLEGVRFPAAIPELDRWYDADIRLGDSAVATQKVTGEFAAGSLADLTDILAGSFNVRVVRSGQVLTLYSR